MIRFMPLQFPHNIRFVVKQSRNYSGLKVTPRELQLGNWGRVDLRSIVSVIICPSDQDTNKGLIAHRSPQLF